MSVKESLKIEDLAEIFDLRADDEIYVFQEKTGTFEKLEIPIAVLSSYFHSKDIADRLHEKSAELDKLSAEFVNWLKVNYPTSAYVKANYSTKRYFSDTYDPIADEISLPPYFLDYATKEYGQFKLAEAKAMHESLHLENAIDSGTSIMKEIDLKNT